MARAPKKVQLGSDPESYYLEYTIRKKSGGVRKIVAPSPVLKRYQRHATHKLNYLFKRMAENNDVFQNFHGFIPHKNCITGAKKHIGFSTTLMMDLSNFFDSVKQKHLQEEIFESLDLDSDRLFHSSGRYAAQGFPSSPAICNLRLIEVVVEMKEWLNANIGIEDTDYSLVIYADDISISYNSTETRDEVWKVIREAMTNIVESNGLQINRKKTRVRFAKYGWRRILGVNVGNIKVRATRKTMKRIRAVRYQANRDSDRRKYSVLGGLTTWSRCILPRR